MPPTPQSTLLKRQRLLPRARAGNAQAQFELACLYDFHPPKRRRAAFAWYLKAAHNGHATAQNYLAESLRDGMNTRRNHKEAHKWFLAAAEQNNSSAQVSLGVQFFQGKGTRKDWKAALKWYRRSAKNGNNCAQHNIAEMYRLGEGVKQNWKLARKWYLIAAENGEVSAMKWLSKIYDPQWHEYQPFRKDAACSFQWISRAAKTGDPSSQQSLGVHYIFGIGVKKNFKTGAKYYRQAARNGDAWAHFSLAVCYRDGWGVPLSTRLARHWFNKAIALKQTAAKKALAKMEAAGLAGEIERLRELAKNYLAGDGVPLNRKKARACLHRANVKAKELGRTTSRITLSFMN